MSIVSEFLAARAAFKADNAESTEAFDSVVQKARDAGYRVWIPQGDVSRAHISATGAVSEEEPAPVSVRETSSPSKKRLFVKDDHEA